MKTKSSAVLSQQLNVASAMGIEIEEKNVNRKNGSGQRFFLWLLGLFVSLAPLFVFHFGAFVKKGTSLFLGFFSDVEILFVCVSMLVSASCEANAQRRHKSTLNGLLILCIVVLALMYSEFRDSAMTNSIATTISIVTITALIITVLCGTFAYFRKER